MKLRDVWAPDGITQFGERSILTAILKDMTAVPPLCVEAGAWNGVHLSNVHHLWKEQGWQATLIESDPEKFESLKAYAGDQECVLDSISPENVNKYARGAGVFSLDVDGDEYQILQAMTVSPWVVIAEYNPCLPPYIEMVGRRGRGVGSSLEAFRVMMKPKGYELVFATQTNAFFVLLAGGDIEPFDPVDVVRYGYLNYLVTDYKGRSMPYGLFPYGSKGQLLASDFELIRDGGVIV